MFQTKPIYKTDKSRTGQQYGPTDQAGPFIAQIKSVGDPTKNNRVSVALLNVSSNPLVDDPSTWIDVSIALPHYGTTPYSIGSSKRTKEPYDGSSSYGITVPQPDVGTTCLVVFANGDRAHGYIIAFISGSFQNTTTVGRGSSKLKGYIAFNDADKEEYYETGAVFPVLEKNLKSIKEASLVAIQKVQWGFDKLMAKILKTQGLLSDTTRGTTTSSIEREVPASVLGMSTKGRPIPDPEDNPAILEKYKNAPDTLTLSEIDILSRKPGHSFSMDDGSVDGNNNLIRLRSGKGAQILLHDKKDLIYIANSKGTSWVEITSEGKIDIFATDSVSLHTKGDYNITTDENFNVKAKNINMMASGNTDIVTTGITSIDSIGTIGIRSTGNILQKGALIHMNSSGNLPPEHTGLATARIPNHEPWGQHEDYDSTSFTQEKTAAGLTNQVSVTIGTDGVLVVGTSSTGE